LKILGLKPDFKEKELNLDKEHIENMIFRRKQAKEEKNFDLADKIRDELQKEGILLEDKKSGTEWKKI
jgi:cysteinyl-tRNA synthetase